MGIVSRSSQSASSMSSVSWRMLIERSWVWSPQGVCGFCSGLFPSYSLVTVLILGNFHIMCLFQVFFSYLKTKLICCFSNVTCLKETGIISWWVKKCDTKQMRRKWDERLVLYLEKLITSKLTESQIICGCVILSEVTLISSISTKFIYLASITFKKMNDHSAFTEIAIKRLICLHPSGLNKFILMWCLLIYIMIEGQHGNGSLCLI